jgi:hypothetical protein
VQILQDEQRRRSAKLLDERQGYVSRLAARRQTFGEIAAERGRDIRNRTERRGRGEVLAGALQHAPRGTFRQRSDERRLADTCLAAEEEQAPTFRAGSVEVRQQFLALEQLGHSPILRRNAAQFKPSASVYD